MGGTLFAQVTMVISFSHQARMAVIKSANPQERFAKRFCGTETAHAGPGRLTSLAGRLAYLDLACIVCIIPAASRGPVDVIAISASGSLSTSVRAYCRSRASSRRLHHAHYYCQIRYRDAHRARICGRAFSRGCGSEEELSF